MEGNLGARGSGIDRGGPGEARRDKWGRQRETTVGEKGDAGGDTRQEPAGRDAG